MTRQSHLHLSESAWTLDIHATFQGSRDDAEHVAGLIERLAKRRGCRDLDVGVYEQPEREVRHG